jgi:DNA-binding IclR family transcriptional regulator
MSLRELTRPTQALAVLTNRWLTCATGDVNEQNGADEQQTSVAPAGRSDTVASVERAAQILQMFLGARHSFALTEVAESLGVANSTAHRLLRTLCTTGLLQQDAETRRYELSLLIPKLGYLALTRSNLFSCSITPLDILHRTTGEGCHVSVPDLPEVVFFQRRDSARTLLGIARLGNRAPANCSSTGKVLLAHAPPALREDVLEHGLVRLTEYSITDPVRLSEELEAIRVQGFAHQQDETELGMTSVAAPIFDRGGNVVAAVGLAGLTERMRLLSLPRAIAAVTLCSQQISGNLSLQRRLRVPLAGSPPETGSARFSFV